MRSLHITLTDLKNQSRLLKEVNSLVKYKLATTIDIAGLHADGLLEDESFSPQIHAHRFLLVTRKISKGLLFQIIKYLEFSFKVYFYYRNRNIHCINIHTVDLLPLGVILKKVWKSKLIYDTHELETETNGLVGIRKKISKWVEQSLIGHVDMTIVVSESIADWYANEYKVRRPVVVLNAPSARAISKKNIFRQQLGIRDDQLIFLYQGGLDTGRGVQLVLDVFKAQQDDHNVIIFMGYGPLQPAIQSAASRHKNIYFHPAVAPQVLLEYTASADLGIYLIQNTCLNHNYCMPNKLFEYAMAGLPVLVSNMKDMSELVAKNQMGYVISDFSMASVNRAIEDLLTKDLTIMKANANRTALENAWEIQEQKMHAAYQAIGMSVEINQGQVA
jgi:glycosyltransferase involved in cell wall biosynthesis